MALPLFPPIIPSRNMYKGHMDKAKVGRFEGGRQGWVGQGWCGGVKMETILLEQQKKVCNIPQNKIRW